MTQYINKATAAAEIEKLREHYSVCKTRNIYEEGLKEGRLIGYKDALHKLDAIEAKEMDLEKHLKEYIEDVFFDIDGVAVKGATHYLTIEDIKDIAKHFFELGLKTKSNWDSFYIQDIDDMLKEMSVDPDSMEANNFKNSYYKVLDKLMKEKGLSI